MTNITKIGNAEAALKNPNIYLKQSAFLEKAYNETKNKKESDKVENDCFEYMQFLFDFRNFLNYAKYKKVKMGDGVFASVPKKESKELYESLIDSFLLPEVLKEIKNTGEILLNYTNYSLEEIYGSEYYNYHT